MLIMNNLPCGYFRDLQIIKEVFLPAFDELKDCLQMTAYIINKIEVNEHILDNPMYDPMFSVEEVNRLAMTSITPTRAPSATSATIRFKPSCSKHSTASTSSV